jgi:hypothetical protein
MWEAAAMYARASHQRAKSVARSMASDARGIEVARGAGASIKVTRRGLPGPNGKAPKSSKLGRGRGATVLTALT